MDSSLREKWILATNRKGFIPSKNARLCSAHFEPSAFEIGGLRKQLKPDAVPTLFDLPQHLQKVPPRRRRPIKKQVTFFMFIVRNFTNIYVQLLQ